MPKVLIADELSPRAPRPSSRERGVEVDVQHRPEAGRAASPSSATTTAWPSARRPRSRPRCWPRPSGSRWSAAPASASTTSTSRPRPQRGVVVMNTPFGNSVTTAEHAIALMLALARQIPAADRSTRAGKWEKNRFMGVELSGKMLGLIGCGNIGSIVADRAHRAEDAGDRLRPVPVGPSGRRTSASRRSSSTSCWRAPTSSRCTRRSPSRPATSSTPRQPDEDQAGRAHRQLRPRRPGRRAGGGRRWSATATSPAPRFDVFADRAGQEQSPLFGARRGGRSRPHLGASTGEAQENVALQVAEQMADYLLTGAVVNALNMPVGHRRGGAAAAALHDARRAARQVRRPAHRDRTSRRVTISYAGQVAALNTRPLTPGRADGPAARRCSTASTWSTRR